MARRPIKKRKPRKSVKAPTFDKIIRNVFAKKTIPRNPKFKLKIGGTDHDQFFVHPDTIPDGIALQWVTPDIPVHRTESMMDRCLASGWKLVKECKPISSLILMWAPQALANAQRDANIKIAHQQIQEARELFGMNSSDGPRWPIVSDSFIVSEPYQTIPSDTLPIDVNVTVKFRLSGRFQEAAAMLKIAPEVYAQRRIALYIRGELGGILLPVHDALELFEGGNFNINSRSE